jgi:hypothetical protein
MQPLMITHRQHTEVLKQPTTTELPTKILAEIRKCHMTHLRCDWITANRYTIIVEHPQRSQDHPNISNE